MKNFSLFLLFICFSLSSWGQKFTFGDINNNDFQVSRNTIDSAANAVVLQEFGTSNMQFDDSDGRMKILFEYHIRIKIFSKAGLDQANIMVPLYAVRGQIESLSDLKASTFNLENGTIEETEMNSKAVFLERRNSRYEFTKFTLPNVKEGSIIEYQYKIHSPNIFNYRGWTFQTNIPKLQSQYVANIPAIYNYNVILRGPLPLTDQKSDLNISCLRYMSMDIDCSRMTYTMKNIPAFIEENYMTASTNFESAIFFELSDVQLPNGTKQNYTKTWQGVETELKAQREFGGQMKRKDVFKDIVPSIISGTTDDLEKAKKIYAAVKKQLKWNNFYGIFTEEALNLKNLWDRRSGSVAELNLALIAALSAADLDAEAVILSTRENGNVSKIYPVINNFNYVIAKVNIGADSYLLDVTEPLLPFGLLPLRCINDQGRVISLKKPSYWIDLKARQKNVTNYTLEGNLTADGKIKGEISIYRFGYSALNKRNEIKKYNSISEYVEKLDEQLPHLKILGEEITNIDSLDLPLIEKFKIEFTAHHATTAEQIYLNPFLINRITKNPFNLNDRTYPVDLGSTSDERIVINLTLDKPYQLISKPNDLAITLPDNGGRYILQTNFSDQKLSVNQLTQLNKAIYEPDQYLYLKELYAKIIQSQNGEFLLKK